MSDNVSSEDFIKAFGNGVKDERRIKPCNQIVWEQGYDVGYLNGYKVGYIDGSKGVKYEDHD